MNDVSVLAVSILVVDDEPEIVTLVSFQLEHAGYSVHGAYSGGQALEVAAHEPISLVVLDLMLPDMSGLKVLGNSPVPAQNVRGRRPASDGAARRLRSGSRSGIGGRRLPDQAVQSRGARASRRGDTAPRALLPRAI